MNYKKSLTMLAALGLMALNATSGNIDSATARATAAKFLQQKQTTMFKSAPSSSLKLTHTEASSVDGNAYYVFNMDGGGWVIVAGDDHANQILAYSNTGSFDMNSAPAAAKGYLKKYKAQIDFMKNYKGEVVPYKMPKRTTVVEPLLKSKEWAQQSPFNYQCVFNGQACSVGCAGLAMAQILNYWEYPKECSGLSGYSPSWNLSVPSLPATTFDYDLILDQYTYWNDEGKLAWLDGVTDDNKQEVAKLCRYASQSCLMNFSPDGSGSNVTKQYKGFLALGYDAGARLLGIEAWPTRETWNTEDYTDEEWMSMMNAELEAGHPLPYSSEGFSDGHAFVVDGVDADGLYHVSWGWYGRGDGWFQHGAFNVTVQGQYMEFNESLFMVVDLFPYPGYEPPTHEDPVALRGDVNADGEVNISDLTFLIDYLLGVGTSETADCNMDGEVDIDDVTSLVDYLIKSEW